MSLLKSLFFLLLLTLPFQTSCTKRITPVAKANKEQILLLGNSTEPESLDPHLTTGLPEYKILIALFEGLTQPHPKTLEPLPGTAESWEISQNGLVYTFFLRPNARWSNGDPVTAHDFVFSYKRILSPNLGSSYEEMFSLIQNASAYNKGQIKDFSKVGIKALDDHTLQITLEHPSEHFLTLLFHHAYFPVHPPTILAHGDIDTRSTNWAHPGHHVGNGPFQLSEWNLYDFLGVKKNPYYWDAENVQLQGIRFYPLQERNTEERAFRAGQIHITDSVPVTKIETYIDAKSPSLRMDPWLGTYYYLINVHTSPLNDPRIRQALNLAIDRQAIVENVTRGGQLPAFGMVPPNTSSYFTKDLLRENIPLAQRLLAEAGYPGGKGFPTLEILYNSAQDHRILAETIQHMWKKNLGITIELINQSWPVFLARRQQQDFQIARGGWIGDYYDPEAFLSLWISHSGNNHTGWTNPEFDSLLEAANYAPTIKERYRIFQKAEALLLKELPFIPIYYYTRIYLINPCVQGWEPNLLDIHPYQKVTLQP